MKVKELIEFLQTQPQDLDVAYELFSEYCLMEPAGISICEAQPPRPDGWVHRERDDKPKQQYLIFPGN